jgi:iron complex outermembrane recepter protein
MTAMVGGGLTALVDSGATSPQLYHGPSLDRRPATGERRLYHAPTMIPERGAGSSCRRRSDRGGQPGSRATASALALALGLTAAPAGAQQPDESPDDAASEGEEDGAGATAAPETIVVVGSRGEIPAAELPLAVSVIELEPLEGARESTNLGEVLDGVPGLVARNRSNFAQDLRLSLRGFGARSPFGIRGVTVVLDGIPLTMPDGQAQVDVVDPSMLSRVEVLRGPAGALYGNGAGGVIYLETPDGGTRPGADAALELGAFGTSKVMVRAAERSGDVSWTFSLSRLDVDGYRARSGVEQTLAHGKAAWQIASSTELRLVATYLDSPVADDPGGLTRAEMRDSPTIASPGSIMFATGESVSQPQIGAVLQTRPSPHDLVDASVYYDARDFTGLVPTRVVELDHTALGASARYLSTRAIAGLPTRLTAGVDAQRMRDRRRNYDNRDGMVVSGAQLRQNEIVLGLGAYGQAHVKPLERLGLLAGGRIDLTRFELDDQYDDDGDQSGSLDQNAATGMAGAIVTPLAGRELDVYGNVAQSVETPTLTELALRPGGEPGLNPDLRVQRATSFEVGARGRQGRLRGELAAFYVRLRGELIPFEDETGRTYYRNAGRSHRTGAEAAALLTLPADLDVRVAYSWLRARFDDSPRDQRDLDGNDIPGIVPHQLSGSLSWRRPDGPFASAELSYMGRTFADDANTARAPSAVLLDATAGYRGQRGSLRYQVHVGVANLLDRRYADNLRLNADAERYFEPGPPIRLFGGLTLGWARAAD